jgi:hypothetical protein
MLDESEKLEALPFYIVEYINKKLKIIKSDIVSEDLENSRDYYIGYTIACQNILSAIENYYGDAGEKFIKSFKK